MRASRRIAVLSIMVAQALVLSILESFIPIPLPFPGIKLGLANIITIYAIVTLSLEDALLIVFARTFLMFLLSGIFNSFLYSLAGGVSSCLVMFLLYKLFQKHIGWITISISGSLIHNAMQLIVASILLNSFNVFYFSPVLLLSGVIMGVLIGLAAEYTINPVNRILSIGCGKNVE